MAAQEVDKKVELEDDGTSVMIITNEGYKTLEVIEKGIGIINLKCSGKLCMDTNDPNCHGQFVENPKDASDKLIMYELHIDTGRRDEPQPKVIMLESQLKKHHFLHWTKTSPFVTFQKFERYESDLPQIDINNDSDQKFVWVIPINQEGGNQFSLQPYDRGYRLKRGSTVKHGSTIIEQAVIVESGGDDETDFYKVDHDP